MRRILPTPLLLGAWVLLLGPGGWLPAAETKTESAAKEPTAKGDGGDAEKEASPLSKELDRVQKLRKAKRYDDALAALDNAGALALDIEAQAKLQFTVGQVYFSRSQDVFNHLLEGVDAEASMQKAIAALDGVVKNFPQAESAGGSAYLLGSAYLVLGDLEKAAAAYRRAYGDFPQSHLRSKSLLRTGVCQAGLGQGEAAIRTFQKVVQDFPGATGDVTKARKYLREQQVVGKTAPPIPTTDWLFGLVEGDVFETFDGQVMVVIFFATWCNHCSHNMPRLKDVMEKWRARGVAFIGVANPNDPMNTEPVDAYVEKNKIPFDDVALDRGYRSWGSYRVGGLPACAIVDRERTIRWRGNASFLPEVLLERLNRE